MNIILIFLRIYFLFVIYDDYLVERIQLGQEDEAEPPQPFTWNIP